MKKLLLSIGLLAAGFFASSASAAVAGVMPYDADFVAPPGYIKMVDNIDTPTEMVIIQRENSEDSYDFEQLGGYDPISSDYAVPTMALRNMFLTTDEDTSWRTENEDVRLINDGNRPDWLSDATSAGEGDYNLMRVDGEGEGHWFAAEESNEAKIRLIYTGPSFEGYGCVNYSGAAYIGSVVLNPDGTVIGCGEPEEGDEDLIPGGVWADWVEAFNDRWDEFTARLGLACDDCYQGGDIDDGEGEGDGQGIPLGFTINYYGYEYDTVFVNSNGSVSFGEGSSSYDQPLDEILGGMPGVCAYCLDIQNNNQINQVINGTTGWTLTGAEWRHTDFVYRGRTTFEGRTAFVATWINMPAYSSPESAMTWNTFQIMFVDIDDETTDVDIIINYGSMRNEDEQGYCLDEEDEGYVEFDDEEEDVNPNCNRVAIGLGTASGDVTIYNSIVSDSGTILNGMSTYQLWDEGDTPLNQEHLNSEIPGRFIFEMRGGVLPGSELSYGPGCLEEDALNYQPLASEDNDDCAYAPINLAAVSSDGQIIVNRDHPMSGAVRSISSYTLKYAPGNVSVEDIASADTGSTLTGLSNNGVTYTLQICAIFSFDEEFEACSNAITTLRGTAPTNGGGGGGGGGGISRDFCPDGDFTSSYYDGKCGEKPIVTIISQDPAKTPEQKPVTITASDVYNKDIPDGFCFERKKDVTISDSATIITTAEFKKALTFLYSYDLTMFNSIDAFALDEFMTRQQAAKMFSNFAVNVLCRKPNNATINYTDTADADITLKPYITLAYQLGLMKGSTDGQFRPHDLITKAELNAVLTRMILKGMLDETGDVWYAEYNRVADMLGIITKGAGLDPVSRHDAALMLFRAYKGQAFTLQDVEYESFVLKNRGDFVK